MTCLNGDRRNDNQQTMEVMHAMATDLFLFSDVFTSDVLKMGGKNMGRSKTML